MGIAWCNEWREILGERHRLYIERELAWELDQIREHALRGRVFHVVGARNLYNDFILFLDDEQTYAYVHLVWKPAPPPFRRIGDENALHHFVRNWKAD